MRVESADVIHDFWVPQLGRKMDATPGHPTHVWLQAEVPGTYTGACAEYCGSEHAWMRIVVVAQPPAEFDAWESTSCAPALAPAGRRSDARRGALREQDVRAVPRHRRAWASNVHVAPDLTHLAERRRSARASSTNDPANLARWLRDPQGDQAGQPHAGPQPDGRRGERPRRLLRDAAMSAVAPATARAQATATPRSTARSPGSRRSTTSGSASCTC